MTRISSIANLLRSLTILSACSGGGGDQQSAEQLTLFFGSTDPAASRSGLDYADGTQDDDDLTGQTHTVRVTRTVTDRQTGEATQITTDEVVTLGAPEADGLVDNFTITLDGETLTFVDGAAERDDGTRVVGFERDITDSITTEYVTAFQILADFSFAGRVDETTVGFFVTGFETSPDAIAADTGSVTYSGNLFWIDEFPRGVSSFDGTFTFNASFADSTIDGTVLLDDFETALGEGTVDLDLASTAITGNGFAGFLTVSDCSFDSCTSDSEIGGVFYGPDAGEVAGIIALDITATDGGVSDQVNGSAAFVGAQE